MLDANTIALLNQLGFDAGSIESLMSSLIVVTVLTVITAIPTGILAKRKGRSGTFWVLFALSIPVVPLLLIWLLPKLPSDEPPAER
ncbi:MAG: hypothetical protein NTV11_05215 [Rhodocyclales bacterium]|nr:hypothetical protein [Rhodocyclales bacterium]